MIIAGLGRAGCQIAELFRPHSKTYKILFFDENIGIKPQENVEDYDDKPIKFKSKSLEGHSEGTLFVCGAGKVAGASLRVLEALRALQMTVVYIVPDLEFSSREQRMRNRVHYSILQEYARSGLIREMILISNKSLLEWVGSGPISRYYEKVNYFIYSTFQNLNYSKNVKQDFAELHELKEVSRISTIGYAPFEGGEEKLFFPLDNITETRYIINIDEEDLDNNEEIIPRCQQIVRENKAKERETSFAIWKNGEGENHYYVRHYTHFIQEDSRQI